MAESCRPLPVAGFENEFVNSIPDTLSCPICLLPFRDPHLVSCCGAKFCEQCIGQVKDAGKPCPMCKQEFVSLLDRSYQRKVLELKVHCSKKKDGCQWVGELRHLVPHEREECGWAMVECRNQCGTHLPRRLMDEHVHETCPQRPIDVKLESFVRKMETKLSNERERHERELSAVKEELKREREAHTIEINKLKEFMETKLGVQKIETDFKIAEQKKEIEYKMVLLESMIPKNKPAIRSCTLTREVIWVDPNIHNEENSGYVRQLRATEGISLYSTSKASEALRVLKNRKAGTEYRAITAGRGGKEFVRSLRAEGIHCRVLVFCGNVDQHETWTRDYFHVEVTRFTSVMMKFATWKDGF